MGAQLKGRQGYTPEATGRFARPVALVFVFRARIKRVFD